MAVLLMMTLGTFLGCDATRQVISIRSKGQLLMYEGGQAEARENNASDSLIHSTSAVDAGMAWESQMQSLRKTNSGARKDTASGPSVPDHSMSINVLHLQELAEKLLQCSRAAILIEGFIEPEMRRSVSTMYAFLTQSGQYSPTCVAYLFSEMVVVLSEDRRLGYSLHANAMGYGEHDNGYQGWPFPCRRGATQSPLCMKSSAEALPKLARALALTSSSSPGVHQRLTHLLVYFDDHGKRGSLSFGPESWPSEYLWQYLVEGAPVDPTEWERPMTREHLLGAIRDLRSMAPAPKLLIYIDACHSSSMFTRREHLIFGETLLNVLAIIHSIGGDVDVSSVMQAIVPAVEEQIKVRDRLQQIASAPLICRQCIDSLGEDRTKELRERVHTVMRLGPSLTEEAVLDMEAALAEMAALCGTPSAIGTDVDAHDMGSLSKWIDRQYLVDFRCLTAGEVKSRTSHVSQSADCLEMLGSCKQEIGLESCCKMSSFRSCKECNDVLDPEHGMVMRQFHFGSNLAKFLLIEFARRNQQPLMATRTGDDELARACGGSDVEGCRAVVAATPSLPSSADQWKYHDTALIGGVFMREVIGDLLQHAGENSIGNSLDAHAHRLFDRFTEVTREKAGDDFMEIPLTDHASGRQLIVYGAKGKLPAVTPMSFGNLRHTKLAEFFPAALSKELCRRLFQGDRNLLDRC